MQFYKYMILDVTTLSKNDVIAFMYSCKIYFLQELYNYNNVHKAKKN